MANDSHDPREGASIVDTTRANSSTEELRREDGYSQRADTTAGHQRVDKEDQKSDHRDH
jgi:hypothetical protein